MKKEKTVRTYQRRTKSGKIVTVHEHKASYDAAEEMRKAIAKKAGAGSELSKKKAVKEESPLGFSEADYKEWYHWDMENDANNEAALRVEKALIKKMGKRAYNKYLKDMTDSYSARGHKKAHQALLDEHTARQKKQDVESAKTAKDIARGAKEKVAEAKTSKVKDNKSIKAPRNESKEQREARWNRGEFTDDEKATAIMVYDLSGSKNNLHPKLSAWAKKEIKRMDDERAAKVDTKILKGLDRDVVSKLATLSDKKKLSKEDEAFIDKHVAPSGLIRGTKVSAFDAISAHKKDSKSSSTERAKASKATARKNTDDTATFEHTRKGSQKEFEKQGFSLGRYSNGGVDTYKMVHPDGRVATMRADGTYKVSQRASKSQGKSSAKTEKSAKKPISTKASYTSEPKTKKSISKEPISEQSLNSKGFKTFKMPQIGTLYLGKRGKGAYIKFKGKKTIQKATIDDYEDFITGHNGLTKAQKKQLSSLGYTEHEEY